MSFYYCKKCGYTFITKDTPDQCPDCGKPEVRPALQIEILRHIQDMQEEGLVGLPHKIPA